jgi:DNA-directed RNA polymerase subunit RPC12/RpoP
VSDFACPDCGADAPDGTRAGAPYACPDCGNPVLPARARTRAGRDAGPVEPETGARPAWKLALVAFVVLGAAYFGLYELLTAEAKKERDRLYAKHGAAVTAFADPGAPPQGGDAAGLKAYLAARENYDDRLAYQSRLSRIDTMFTALMLAFGAQSVFTAILLAKTALRMRKASTGRAPRA